jgi:hypothetical protein
MIRQSISTNLPGHELVSAGVADLRAGRETECSLLVAMASRRLRALGVEVPEIRVEEPSHRLYELLTESDAGGYSRYNALIRRLTSFIRAAEHARSG